MSLIWAFVGQFMYPFLMLDGRLADRRASRSELPAMDSRRESRFN
jgi:hypothetical protein